MIKRLQLRGISRNPSDRYTEDGGCAESLNVFLDNNETAPTLKPEIINGKKDDRGIAMFPTPTWGYNWEAVFIHKTPSHAVFIHKTPSHERAIIKYVDQSTRLGVWNGSTCVPFMTLEQGEEFIRCINLGNSLGVVTSKGTNWVLMKNGEYKYLGRSVPFPSFTFANIDVAASDVAGEEVYREKVLTHYLEDDADPPQKSGLSSDSLSWLNDEINLVLAQNARQGIFNRPMMAVLALELFDGTRMASAPVMIAPGFDNPYSFSDYHWYHPTTQSITPFEWITVTFNMAYKLFFRLDSDANFFDRWEDIVESLEIYLSPQIDVDRSKSYFEDDYHADTSGGRITEVYGTPVLGKGDSPLERILQASNFYRVYSEKIDSESIAKLRQGIVVDTKDYMTTDSLVTAGLRLDTLSDMKHYQVNYTSATLYNNKVIASGISEKIRMNIHNPIATYYYNPELASEPHPTYTYSYSGDSVLAYRLTFYLRDGSGKSVSIKVTDKEGEYFFFQKESINGSILWSNGYGMIMCPDARAFAVDVQALWGTPANIRSGSATVIGSATLGMTEHPNLDCSYWYGDITKELFTYCSQSGTYTAGAESYIENSPNKIYMSEMDNPLVFPISSRYTMNSRVLGCAIATAALSEGQFGQFPIYAFTEDGIWAMESASDGTIVSTKPMSREICNNPDSITSIDNAVVFTTDKTVMLISGSQVADISPFMNGQHYYMDTTSKEWQMISQSDWRKFVNPLSDETHFMAFMEDAQIAYDYKGNRLIFINGNETFQYVYMLRTNTWHRLYAEDFDLPIKFSFTLNNYPFAYVNMKSTSNQYVLDLSGKMDVTSSESLRGIIVTRPFDLGEPDVRKGIRDIRIRGRFNRSDARYILLGSMDCINWGVMPSLHGGSYKWFRLIILTSLSPTERISWIDIDYDTRMQNKLR